MRICVGLILSVAIWACADSTDPSAGEARYPLDSWHVSQEFGVWNSSWGGYHLAEDAEAIGGDPVYAMADGVVGEAYVGASGYGAVMLVEHRIGDETVVSLYGHVSTRRGFEVEPGQAVSKGQLIAFVADDDEDGGPWGPHLHFGIRKGPFRPDVEICGIWLYVGYTRECGGISHSEYLDLWYDPGSFIGWR